MKTGHAEKFGPSIKHDLPSGLVVFLVALPLCLGIALASDAPLLSGVLCGIIAGLVVSLLSGSELSVSGPAAGLTVVVAGSIHTLGSFQAFLLAVCLSGAIQIALSFVKAGSLAGFFPNAVIKGMLAAIGLVIILKQFPHALGKDDDWDVDLSFLSIAQRSDTFTEIVKAFYTLHWGALILALLSVGVLLLWETKWFKSQAWTKWLPGPLMAVAIGIVGNNVLETWGLHVTAEKGHLVALPGQPGFAGLFAGMQMPIWSGIASLAVWKVAFTIAIIGSIETLLCIQATDKLDPYHRASSTNRELFAQGVGNLLSGFVGGLPMTSVIVRSSANVYAGARTRLSAFFHGLFLLLAVVAIPHVLNQIPLASLAAVLILVGYKLAKVSLFRSVYRQGMQQFLPFIVTVITVVAFDLLTGVIVGLLIGIGMTIKTNYYSAITVANQGNNYLIRFAKDVSFVNKLKLKSELAKIPPGSHVIVDGSKAMFIDDDIHEMINDYMDSAPLENIRVQLHHIEDKRFRLQKVKKG